MIRSTYYYREKIAKSSSPGWEWGWVARHQSGLVSVIRDADVPVSSSSAARYTDKEG